MFGLLDNEKVTKIESLAKFYLEQNRIERLVVDSKGDSVQLNHKPSLLSNVVLEEFNGSLDERLVPDVDGKLNLFVSKTLPSDVKNLTIAKGIARIVLEENQQILKTRRKEDYLYGSDWTHTQNDEIKYLALCLIMPKEMFKSVLEKHALNEKNERVSIDILKVYFSIPDQAIIQRGMALKMISASRHSREDSDC